MTELILGLALFLGVHSIRILADDWRQAQRARLGPARWNLSYSVLSLLGLVLLVWGYGQARQQPVLLWSPPPALNQFAALLMLLSLVLVAAAFIPRNAFKQRLGHPMVLGVKVWALAHLLVNGTLAEVTLFGAFLLWAVASFRAARRRDRAAAAVPPSPAPSARGTGMTVLLALLVWSIVVFWLHAELFGVAPLG